MEEKNTTVPVTIDTRKKLKELAKRNKRSVIRYLEVEISNKHKKIFCSKVSETIIEAI